jgi:hypothetical protein
MNTPVSSEVNAKMFLSHTLLTAVLVVFSAVPIISLAEDTVTIGDATVSANCALARKEHPRLLFTTADLPRLRERLKHPRIAAELEHAKRLASENKAGAILLGVLYYLTEEPKYIEAAKVKLEPSWVQTYPLAADLVMGAMTPAEQEAEADRIVEIIKQERWRPHVVLDLAAWGHGHDDFLDADLKSRLRTDMIEGTQYNNLWSRGRGGSSMSHGYYGEHFYSEWFTMAVAWSNATGQDWISKCDFAAHTPEYYIYHYRPWTWPPQVVHIGVNAMCAHWQSITPAKFQGDNLAVVAATKFHDGLGQWWTDEVISTISMGWGTSALGQGGVWGKLLWYEPKLPRVDPKMLPPARLFPENGHVVMRSDWTENATYALFRCGRYGEIDGWWGRNNADNLHFIIAKRGILAADTGAVHSLNNAALGFAGSQVHSDGLPHMRAYARQTIAHNSITVGSQPLELRGWNNALLATVRGGGQSPIQDESWWKLWDLPKPKAGDRPFREGRIIAYETSPLFDYAAGDATYSYPPTRVKSITRQFVYLRPDTFVVFDRVVNAKPELETKWLLHTLYEPWFDGEKVPDTSLPPTEQLVVTPDGSGTAPNPKPGGRFLHEAATSFMVDDQWPEMTGRLFGQILVPDDGNRVVRTVGGPWHEFEVDGVNYGPTEEAYAEDRSLGHRKEHDRENSIGLGGWRIELSAKDGPVATNFLVVLQATDQTTESMVPVERIERENQIGAKVSMGTTAYKVTFATAGPTGGHIRVEQTGKVVLDRALAAEVEDNYDKWSEDSRYEAWMTRPEYRNFIDGHQKQIRTHSDD